MALDPALLTDAPNQFESALERFLVRPAKMKFNHVMLKAKQAQEKKPQAIGTESPDDLGLDPAHPLMIDSQQASIEYGTDLAEIVAMNSRLKPAN